MAENQTTMSQDLGNERFAAEVAERKLDVQFRSVDTIDSKTGIMFGFASAVLTLPAAALATGERSIPEASIWLASFGIGAYVAMGLVSIFSLSLGLVISLWSYGPTTGSVISRAQKPREPHLAILVAKAYSQSIEDNRRKWNLKGWLSQAAMALFLVEALLLGIAIVIILAN